MNKARNSSIELLRIISMMFIVSSHFCVHGGFVTQNVDFSLNQIILNIGVLGNLGVTIFVMISGYFTSQTTFKFTKMIKLMLQVFFYSFTIYFVMVALKVIPFSFIGAVKAIFPIVFSEYWFATVYIVFYLFTPFLNRLLTSFSKKQYVLFLGAILLIWSVLPTFTAQTLGGNEFCQFVMFYSIGAFVRKYQGEELRLSTKYRFWIVSVSAFLLILSVILLSYLATIFPVSEHITYFLSRQSILNISLSYGLLLVFVNIRPFFNRLVNIVSSTTFGIYLLHDNTNLREIIWNNILNVKQYQHSPYLLLYMIFSVVTVFIFCSIIDYLRQKCIEKPVMNILEPLANRLNDKMSGALDRVIKG